MAEGCSFASQNRIKEATKDKFDVLLKQALNLKGRKNTQNIAVLDAESFNSNSDNNAVDQSNLNRVRQSQIMEIVQVDVHNDIDSENFILNKFLNDSSNITKLANEDNSDETFTKAPKPAPRKKLKSHSISSVSSAGTYNITLPTVIDNINIKRRENSDEVAIKSDSQATDTANDKKIADENESENQTSINSKQCSIRNSIRSDSELTADEITFENEIKGKSKKKSIYTTRERDLIQQLENKYKYSKIVGITIHESDYLKLDSLVIHPVVKVHIVNGETGEYVRKSDRNRSTVFFYENKDIPYITPVISESYGLYEKRSLRPAWEETLIINEDLEYLLEENNFPVLFFEIMDFLSFSTVNSQFYRKGPSRGWHKVAWAFLKLLGKDNSYCNIERRARLQLYYPGKYKKVLSSTCDIFHWLNSKKLIKYPSTLYVTVKGIIPPEKVIETLRSKTPISGEKASKVEFELESRQSEENCILNISKNSENVMVEEEITMQSKPSCQICKFPNKCVAELPTYDEGCLIMKFSNDGLHLAYSVLFDETYYIVIYSVKTKEKILSYSSHQGLIYSINWSEDDEIIITASADCTVCIWNFIERSLIQMLPHPSYVYTSAISKKNMIITGCYDQNIRIWTCNTQDNKVCYDLFQELEGHAGYVTSLSFNNKSTLLYSSDSVGEVIEWKIANNCQTWTLKRQFKLVDLRNVVINQILLHAKERRLLIHARDSILRIIDLKTGCVLHWLQGGLNNKFQTTCSFSYCGTYIYVGNENGFIHVWNSDTGQMAATYTPYNVLNYKGFSIQCVQFHPRKNKLAVSHYGRSVPILLIEYDQTSRECRNIGLNIFNDATEVRNKKIKIQKPETTRDITSENTEDGVQKKGKIKLKDVMQKLDQIIISKPVSSDLDS